MSRAIVLIHIALLFNGLIWFPQTKLQDQGKKKKKSYFAKAQSVLSIC